MSFEAMVQAINKEKKSISIITYIQNSISFGATVSGLCCNAGLGFMFLFKDNKDLKNNLLILASLIAISLFSGYLILICETLLALL